MLANSSIRKKLVTVMLLLVLSVLVILTVWQVSTQKGLLQGELNKQTDLLLENLNNRALFQADQVKRQAEEEIASFNLFELTSALVEITRTNEELEFIILTDHERRIVVHTADSSLQQKIYSDTLYPDSLQIPVSNGVPPSGSGAALSNALQQVSAILYRLPVEVGNRQWGELLLSYSLSNVKDEVARSRLDNAAIIQGHTIRSLLAATTILLITFVVISRLSSRLSAPIIRLTEMTQRLAQGDFSVASQGRTESSDEVGVLSRQFSEMAINLEKAYHDLEEYNLLLERKVNERTQQLNLRNEELVKAINDLEESQQQLVHSEKMAALGQLVASIAHEINTPLGAIQASAGNATKYYTAYANSLDMLFRLERESDQQLFLWLLHNARPMESLTTREERAAKRKAAKLLDQHEIQHCADIAEMLIDMGLSDQVEVMLPMLSGPKYFEVIQSAHQLTGIMRSNQTIYSATARASKIVFALKSFARQDQFGEKQESDINEGINTVLVLYSGLLKQGCEVVKEFEELPPLDCHADELNQVWTNLIHNALQAMDYKGTLTLRTRVDHSGTCPQIIVQIADTGHGIPLELQHRVWESFFTTKESGEGSGLGLGICRRIVEKHAGRLFFESQPGQTTFTVVLPLAA
ncbi:ATP-binding protein [Ketobacter sp.]|uniref:sensor histidine kinase n=1 Tax=Ketobacter sp. TaxID=2083498 RepID=UPI000F13E5FE|nr:ATP-binding protein [Ketobacter sp.]RLT93243.1 MAG: HAMP domain-containing protein [Ketobacter sp.]